MFSNTITNNPLPSFYYPCEHSEQNFSILNTLSFIIVNIAYDNNIMTETHSFLQHYNSNSNSISAGQYARRQGHYWKVMFRKSTEELELEGSNQLIVTRGCDLWGERGAVHLVNRQLRVWELSLSQPNLFSLTGVYLVSHFLDSLFNEFEWFVNGREKIWWVLKKGVNLVDWE